MFAKALLRQSLNSGRHMFANNATRGVARVMMTQRTVFTAGAMRAFSTNTAQIEKSIQKLTKALEKEIKYENENYAKLDDIETFLNESGFKFTEEESGVVMTLSKTVGDKVVEVQFEAR